MMSQEQCYADHFYRRIAEDCKSSLIQMVGEAGCGKSSSLRTIVKHIKDLDPNIRFIAFDLSQSWYHCAPLQYRQLVTRERLAQNLISNQYDTVYEIGSLSDIEKRAFVGIVLKQIMDQRYRAKLDGTLDEYPHVCFIFEESNLFFDSYSFRKNDEYSQVFQMFALGGEIISAVEY